MLSPLESEFIIATKGELKKVEGRMIPGTRFPMFPGGQFGGSIAEIRELIIRQKRANGVRFATVANARVTVQIPVSGTARMLLGFRVMLNDSFDVGTLQLNNEVLINNVACTFHNPIFTNMNQEYLPLPRPLNGNDEILYTVQSVNAGFLFAEIFFL